MAMVKESQGGTGVLGIELVIIAYLNNYRIRHQLVVFVPLLKVERIIYEPTMSARHSP